ncbi:MAG: TIR domain-containing protein [Balneola sp.]|mgnify:CR=1 FL=1|tara:strand:- start:7866 stop:8363 length:498 start_codon:yes stop_codon:yes gene_type:complete
MARKIFSSFHFADDNWRASQVRNIGSIEGNQLANDNDWESIKNGGDRAIKAWIDSQMKGKSCVVVLIGRNTAGRKWIKYEIEKGWNDGKGVIGVYIHSLKDRWGRVTNKGRNPFDGFTVGIDKVPLSSIVKTYDPGYWTSQDTYSHIRNNIVNWIEEGIRIRGRY